MGEHIFTGDIVKMTRQEHMLMITMFARHDRLIRTLVEILESRDILNPDDMKAYEALIFQSERVDASLLRMTANVYRKVALESGTGNGSELPNTEL